MKIVLASRNRKKIAELRAILGAAIPGIEILSLDDVGLVEEIEENGASFEENARIKALAAAQSGYIGVGDDSGLVVDALGGEPGIYSARFAARNGFAADHNDADNNRYLLTRLADVKGENRTAAFVCCIACVFPDGRECVVRGEVKGRILSEYHGGGGFGYDPLFFYEPLGKTFAELDASEKNQISHRAAAIANLARELQSLLSSKSEESK